MAIQIHGIPVLNQLIIKAVTLIPGILGHNHRRSKGMETQIHGHQIRILTPGILGRNHLRIKVTAIRTPGILTRNLQKIKAAAIPTPGIRNRILGVPTHNPQKIRAVAIPTLGTKTLFLGNNNRRNPEMTKLTHCHQIRIRTPGIPGRNQLRTKVTATRTPGILTRNPQKIKATAIPTPGVLTLNPQKIRVVVIPTPGIRTRFLDPSHRRSQEMTKPIHGHQIRIQTLGILGRNKLTIKAIANRISGHQIKVPKKRVNLKKAMNLDFRQTRSRPEINGVATRVIDRPRNQPTAPAVGPQTKAVITEMIKQRSPKTQTRAAILRATKNPARSKKSTGITSKSKKKEGDLKLDLSLLWGQNNRKNQNGNSRFKSKKRDITGNSEKYMPQCVCTDSENCDQENNINIMNVFKRGRYHLSSKVFQCAMDDKICCMQSPSTPENVLGEDGNDLAEYGKKVGLSRSSCGRRLSKLTDEEINGDGIANYGDFPWMLKMVSQDEYGETMICSASLIHNSIALTTASCAMLLSGDKVRVVAGDWNLFSGHGRNSIRETKIGNIFLHPEFDLVNNKHDVALVFLDQELDSGLGINSVCLPSASDAWDVNRCAIVGWTKEDRQDMRPTSLRIIDLETINQGKCRNSSGNLRNDISESASQDFICAHSQDGIPCIVSGNPKNCMQQFRPDGYRQFTGILPKMLLTRGC
ncbi:UNVERIFIED_CONTAM: hypothetical protein PYX00_000689 [Menopon gallinae]|uniref:Peptidase S1 domain-containing protein n=1 Tax=Menopon gallinae TaxID=328185 RepID=A0AAW2IAA7_9NEOP